MHSPYHQEPKLVAAIGSMTAAIKAQRALASAGIIGEVVALSPSETRKGCAYGLEIPAMQESEARAALRAAHIAVSQLIRRSRI